MKIACVNYAKDGQHAREMMRLLLPMSGGDGVSVANSAVLLAQGVDHVVLFIDGGMSVREAVIRLYAECDRPLCIGIIDLNEGDRVTEAVVLVVAGYYWSRHDAPLPPLQIVESWFDETARSMEAVVNADIDLSPDPGR